MALSENKVTVQNFTGGLITDYHELNTPQNVTVDEANCDLNRKGFRERRLGMAYEAGYTQNPTTVAVATMQTNYLKSYSWKNVNNNANLNFLVVQIGNVLNFYDTSYSPVSNGLLSFTINLDTYKAPTVISTADTGISVDSGNGYLFVAGAKINPFYVTYNTDNTLTVTPITIQVRDLTEQDNTLANDAKPSSPTDKRKYDLFNQGWNTANIRLYDFNTKVSVESGATTVYTFYSQQERVSPPKTGPWWIGKRIGDKGIEVFDPNQYNSVSTGNTLGSLGHYILNAFSKDRAAASGITSLGIEVTTSRPTAIAFYSGRVFYAMGNEIFYSQVITDNISAVGKCYQDADPTSEEINNLIATDGGTILIPESSNPIGFFKIENALILFSSNGTWIISGASTNSGFSATDNSINKISDVSCVSARTIVDAEGIPFWWAPNGIYTLEPISTKQSFSVKNISMKKVQNLYDTIVPLAKKNATGCYDHIAKRVIWLYSPSTSQDDTNNRFYYNNVLILDLLFEAYLKHTVSDVALSQTSKMIDVFNITPFTISTSTVGVTDGAGNAVVDQYANAVTVSSNSYINSNVISSDVKYLVVGPTPVASPSGSSPLSFTFGDFTGTSFLDWTDDGVSGANYTSFLNAFYTIAGYMTPHFTPGYDAMLWMYSPYVYVFLENQCRATVSSTISSAYTPAITVPSIMGYQGGGTVTFDSSDCVPDYVNNKVYIWSTGTGGTNGMSQFDALSTGSELLARTQAAIGGIGGFGAGGGLTLLNNGHITMVDGIGGNSTPVDDLFASGITFNRQFGISSGSLSQSTSSRVLQGYTMCPIRYGVTEGTVMTTLVGSEIDFIPQAGFTNQFVRVLDEALGLSCQGAVTNSYGTAYVLGVPKTFVSNSTPLGLYKVTYSPAGIASAKIGTISPSQVDAAWVHWSGAHGLSYDKTDGNVIMQVSTGDAVAHTAYLVKINAATAAVIWATPIPSLDAFGDFDMPRNNIVNQTLFYIVGTTLYTINTATGAVTTQSISTISINGAQVSDDVSNSVLFRGTYNYTAGTVPNYVGHYMGDLGNHTLSSQWGRWFVGSVAGQMQTTTATTTGGSSCLLQTAWDWSNASASHKWSQQVETFKARNNFDVNVSKNKMRGKGRTMQLRFSSTTGKDFQLAGWGIWYAKNQHP